MCTPLRQMRFDGGISVDIDAAPGKNQPLVLIIYAPLPNIVTDG